MTRQVFRVVEHNSTVGVETILVTMSESKAWRKLTEYTDESVVRQVFADCLDSDPHICRFYTCEKKFREDWF